VAGAGTGKTSVNTDRIAWPIAQRKARPDEILALTFTDVSWPSAPAVRSSRASPRRRAGT